MAYLNPYLNFDGNCREAMTFYKSCFGGELTLQKIGESPMGANLPQEMEQQILHSILSADGITLMGSDMMGRGLDRGNGIMLCVNGNDGPSIEVIFEKLARGGQVKMPLHESFWGATYGELTDRFGFHWMFNVYKS
jgi:PhnB protein